MKRRGPMMSGVSTGLVLGAVTATPLLAVELLPLLGLGWSSRGIEFWVLVPLAALFGCVTLPLGLLARRTRRTASKWLLASVTLLVASIAVARVGSRLRMLGFERAGERATPIVRAIERHVRERGQPPSTIAELHPDYLPELPAGLPPLVIESADGEPGFYEGNPWVLRASVPSGILNFDAFYYWPLQNYPAEGYGGCFERLGAWAYLHE